MMYAILQWDHNSPIDTLPLVIKENATAEEAEVIIGMNKALYHREIITMEQREKMRHG